MNPGELIAVGAQIGCDIDRYFSMELAGVVMSIKCQDGSNATVTLDLNGKLQYVSINMKGVDEPLTLPGIEYLHKLGNGEVPPIPGLKF